MNARDKKIVDLATELAAPLVQAMGLVLWGVEFRGGGGGKNVLRLFVDVGDAEATANAEAKANAQAAGDDAIDDAAISQSGVSIDQCARISRDLGLALEVEDAIPGAYTLEVSSPGFERRFFTAAQMADYVGKEVRVDLFEPMVMPLPGRKKLTGTLLSMEGDLIRLRVDDEDVETHFSAAKRAQLVHRFASTAPKGANKGAKRTKKKKK